MPRIARVRLAPPLLMAAILALGCEKKSTPPPVPLAEHGGYKPLSTRNPARLQALKQEIASAFVGVPYPGDDALVDGVNPYDQESAALVAAFKGKHWKQLTPRELRYNDLAFLSREALQFYLPAYLIGSLYDYGETTYGDILPSTLLSLTLTDGTTAEGQLLRQRDLKRFAVFTPAQKRAIRAFLEYVRNELPEQGDEPRKAIELYWGGD
jgi:hypothetical protein